MFVSGGGGGLVGVNGGSFGPSCCSKLGTSKKSTRSVVSSPEERLLALSLLPLNKADHLTELNAVSQRLKAGHHTYCGRLLQ